MYVGAGPTHKIHHLAMVGLHISMVKNCCQMASDFHSRDSN